MSESSAGQVVNLMATDVNRFDTGPTFLHYLWIGPMEILVLNKDIFYNFTQLNLNNFINMLVLIDKLR